MKYNVQISEDNQAIFSSCVMFLRKSCCFKKMFDQIDTNNLDKRTKRKSVF